MRFFHSLLTKIKDKERRHFFSLVGIIVLAGSMMLTGIIVNNKENRGADATSVTESAEDAELDSEENLAEEALPADLKIQAKTYRKAAKKGDFVAQYQLGLLYFQGKGVRQNVRMSAAWWKKSADRNYLPALMALGKLYLDGDVLSDDENNTKPRVGVKQSLKTAFKYYAQAADLGNAEAQNMMGQFFARGTASRKSPKEAVKYWEKAAAQGNQEAQLSLSEAYKTGKGIRKDQEKADYWRQKAGFENK